MVAPGVTFTRFGRGTVKAQSVSGLVSRTTSAGFALDNGVPYRTNEESYGLALVEELPEYRSDPDKIVRAAAFAGWAFVDEHQGNRVQSITRLLSKRREKSHFA